MIRWAVAFAAIALFVPTANVTIVAAAPPTHRPSQEVVVASAEVHRLQGSARFVGAVSPIAIYEQGQFRKAALVADDEHRLQKLIPKSVLNRVREFDLYLKGESVGVLRVRKVDGTPGCPPEVVGFGQVSLNRALDFSRGDC